MKVGVAPRLLTAMLATEGDVTMIVNETRPLTAKLHHVLSVVYTLFSVQQQKCSCIAFCHITPPSRTKQLYIYLCSKCFLKPIVKIPGPSTLFIWKKRPHHYCLLLTILQL